MAAKKKAVAKKKPSAKKGKGKVPPAFAAFLAKKKASGKKK